MSDIDSMIAEAAVAIEARRAELEPLAADVVAAGSAWASAQWERITDKVVAASPDSVRANIDRLPTLKEHLRSLQSNSGGVADDCLAEWLLHRSLSDDELSALARDEAWFEQPVRVELPRNWSNKGDEPLRRLAGRIGAALNEAGLLTDKSEVEAKGRYRYSLPDHSTVTVPLEAYETALTEFIGQLHAHATLVKKRDSDQATQLWRDA